MESTENYIKQIADVHHFAEEVARAMIDIKMPEFASENMSVADASKLIGLPVTAIRAGYRIRMASDRSCCSQQQAGKVIE